MKRRQSPARRRLSKETRQRVYQRDGGICQHCFLPVSANSFDVDHVKRVVGGGTDLLPNLLTAHSRCNRRRGKRTLEAWRAVLRAEYSHLQPVHGGVIVRPPSRGVRQ